MIYAMSFPVAVLVLVFFFLMLWADKDTKYYVDEDGQEWKEYTDENGEVKKKKVYPRN